MTFLIIMVAAQTLALIIGALWIHNRLQEAGFGQATARERDRRALTLFFQENLNNQARQIAQLQTKMETKSAEYEMLRETFYRAAEDVVRVERALKDLKYHKPRRTSSKS